MTRNRPIGLFSLGLLLLSSCSSGGGAQGASDATTGDGEADVATEGRGDGVSSSLADGAPADATDSSQDATDEGEAEAAIEGGEDATRDGGDADATMAGPDAGADADAYDAPTRPDALLDDGGKCTGECSDAAPDSACVTPDVTGNPPSPAGYQPLPQAQVTPAMTTWTVEILDDATDFPMFSCAIGTFGALGVLARVEWLPPDFQHAAVHRGVVLFEPTD